MVTPKTELLSGEDKVKSLSSMRASTRRLAAVLAGAGLVLGAVVLVPASQLQPGTVVQAPQTWSAHVAVHELAVGPDSSLGGDD
jgi:hypothetical protein